MENNYIKGKGILIGRFTEQDIINKVDKIEMQKAEEKTGLKFSNSFFIKKKGQIVAMDIYMCNFDDWKLDINI